MNKEERRERAAGYSIVMLLSAIGLAVIYYTAIAIMF